MARTVIRERQVLDKDFASEAEIEGDLKFRLSFKSEVSNPDLVVSVLMEMYRQNTV